VITKLKNIKFAFLDRDGVINRKPPEGQFVSRWNDFNLLPGVVSAIAMLNRSGIRAIVVSNQRGVALGRYTSDDVMAIHARLQEHLAARGAHIDAFYFCPHDRGMCNCRKPGTGMFEQAFRDFPEATKANSVLIGDSISDIEAARNFGISSIFILGDPATRKAGADKAVSLANAVSNSLSEAIDDHLS